MKIENVKAGGDVPSAGGHLRLCTFTLVVTDDLKLFDVQLIEAPDGTQVIRPPQSFRGTDVWIMSPELRKRLVEMLQPELMGVYVQKAKRLMPEVVHARKRAARVGRP